ncbi:NAD-dependent deacetylase [Oligella ureolytica]|uniref:Sir2 family NAD-dependent protein deacetylase n=1 Tax=Oligella ureolytica TaxID=90244 RepID=UPI000E059F54|nr:Sir2 family NAD-dependent protein deacetylase [Oligella ureolytica]SUA58422.1 NAD-dependent deacetylase [Oligella ureolytica]
MSKKKLVVLSGAGISAESGLKTFRDSNGLWENHRVEDVATHEAFRRDPELVMHFYNLRRAQLQEVEPNDAHKILAALEDEFDVYIITQNVDNLHERGGSTKVLHLHGELCKARPVDSEEEGIIEWTGDLNIGDVDERGVQLRPHIVWFGEMVPAMEEAAEIASQADIFLVIGTSMKVYPAAGLIDFIPSHCELYVIDKGLENHFTHQENFYQLGASEGMRALKKRLLDKA